MVGNFSRYTTKDVIPSSTSQIVISNPFGDDLKFIRVSTANSPEYGVISGLFDVELGIGCEYGRNVVNNNYTTNGLTITSDTSVTNGKFRITTAEIHLHQTSGNVPFDASTAYHVEMYA